MSDEMPAPKPWEMPMQYNPPIDLTPRIEKIKEEANREQLRNTGLPRPKHFMSAGYKEDPNFDPELIEHAFDGAPLSGNAELHDTSRRDPSVKDAPSLPPNVQRVYDDDDDLGDYLGDEPAGS